MPDQKVIKKPRKSGSALVTPPEPVSSLETSGWDSLVTFTSRIARFGWDLLGVVLLMLALVTALALFRLTEGVISTPWAAILEHWLGWGSGLVVFATGVAGIYSLQRKWSKVQPIDLIRLIAVEVAVFSALALISIYHGGSVERAESGMDGGLVGWGLSELPLALGIDPSWRTAIYALLFIVSFIFSLGLISKLDHWVETELEKAKRSQVNENFPDLDYQDLVDVPKGMPANIEPKVKHKEPVSLPPQFRKSFRVESQPENKISNQDRDERLPPFALLIGEQANRPDEKLINLTAGLIEKSLAEFGVPARVVGFRIGPTVTQYAVEPGFNEKPGPDGSVSRQKVRVSQISALNRDLTLALSAERIRIEAPVPGRSYVGIEVPNARSTIVRLRPILESEPFTKLNSPLAIPIGRDVSGQAIVADLARMPHLLIAGTTGSGKSVCIAAIITCLVTSNTPDDLRLAMIDPKMVELVRFNGLPHIYGKVETELDRILGVLRWALGEMDYRYRLLESARTRDIEAYNRKMTKRKQATLPRMVVIIDELADLMMSAPDQTEHSLVRLAQMARATGIHLVVATQRPSTDVITGLIKANFPARISFTVASSVDSRVILDTPGAETLLGRGDMLFLNPESGLPLRAQGVLVTDQEVERVSNFWQKAMPDSEKKPAPWEELLNQEASSNGSDTLIKQAIEVIRGSQRASASLLQRRLRIGYPRAARLIDELEELGVVGPTQGGGRDREVLINSDDSDHGDEELGEN